MPRLPDRWDSSAVMWLMQHVAACVTSEGVTRASLAMGVPSDEFVCPPRLTDGLAARKSLSHGRI